MLTHAIEIFKQIDSNHTVESIDYILDKLDRLEEVFISVGCVNLTLVTKESRDIFKDALIKMRELHVNEIQM